MAKKKRGKAKSVSSRRRASPKSSNGGEAFTMGLLVLILKVLGVAFLVQGFILQLATGVLYYGVVHYAIGVLAMWGGHALKTKCCK